MGRKGDGGNVSPILSKYFLIEGFDFSGWFKPEGRDCFSISLINRPCIGYSAKAVVTIHETLIEFLCEVVYFQPLKITI
jgi:hypothetical protein